MRRKSTKRAIGNDPGPSRPDLRRLLEAKSALVERITTDVLGRYRLAPEESRALRGLVRARLVADDYSALQSFTGRSSFTTYLVVVIVQLVSELTAGRVPEGPSGAAEPEAAAPPSAAVAVALAFLRGLPPRDRILLRLRFGEQLPLASLRTALALGRAELRRRIGELRRSLLRELTELQCENRHTAGLITAALHLDLFRTGEPGAPRPSNGAGEVEVDDPTGNQVPS